MLIRRCDSQVKKSDSFFASLPGIASYPRNYERVVLAIHLKDLTTNRCDTKAAKVVVAVKTLVPHAK